MNPKNLMTKFDDTVERHLWLKLTQFAIVDALVVGAIMYLFDHSRHPLDTFGHLWFIGGGIVCFLLITAATIWARNSGEEELGEVEAESWYYCEVCGDHQPFSHFPHTQEEAEHE